METNNKAENSKNKIVKILLKDLRTNHTITSLANEINITRTGAWKILKKLENDKLITLNSVGLGKTNTYTIELDWNSKLTEKALAFYLTEESLKYKKWLFDFEKLEREVEFLIIFGSILKSPKEAKDIDILGVAKVNKIGKIKDIALKIQQTQNKKIHSINFTKKELKQELKEKNKAFLDAIKKGVVLFGHEKFIDFIKELKGHGN